MDRTKVLFYVGYDSHIPHFSPLYSALKNDPRFRASMMRSAEYNYPVAHFLQFAAARLGLRDDVFFNPDVTFIADPTHRPIPHPEILININHGVGSKGASYVANPKYLSLLEELDFIFSPSEYFSSRIRGYLKRPKVITTGMPKLDRMFRGEYDREKELKRLGLNASKVILFAPTYNLELSAITVLHDSVLKLANEDTALIVKFHCKVDPSQKALYEKKMPNVKIIPLNEPDITPYMAISDIMVSDYSSAWLEFMAQDKPVVLVKNPAALSLKRFPGQMEFECRDAGIEVQDLDGLKEAVEFSLSDPSARSNIRRKYRDMLFDFRGTSTDRCIDELGKIIKK